MADDEQMGPPTTWWSSFPTVAGSEKVDHRWSSRTIICEIVSYRRYRVNQLLGLAVAER